MDLRHEWKIEISYGDLIAIRRRLSAVAYHDPHAPNGAYRIRSLYFDSPEDRALREKIDGVSKREKYRIRCYNSDFSFIRLEKKSKIDGLCGKGSALITREQTQQLLHGDGEWMGESTDPVLQEFYRKYREERLRPKTVVEYDREAFVYPPGNVRVTFDTNIRTGLSYLDFLDENCVTIPAGDAPILLEVKWDAFLPDIIRDAVQVPGRRSGAFSKYAQCRIYG